MSDDFKSMIIDDVSVSCDSYGLPELVSINCTSSNEDFLSTQELNHKILQIRRKMLEKTNK